jgi:hypothetical protein
MTYDFTTLGALIGLAVSIILIMIKRSIERFI